jgi:predicted branched-subunit amino acid permease
MRTFWRTLHRGTLHRGTLHRGTLRDIGMVCLADALVGASFGALAVAGGLRPWVPVVMSLLIFAGGAQIAAVGVVLAGGGPVAAVVAGLVLNTRMLPYGFAVAGELGGRWRTRLAGALAGAEIRNTGAFGLDAAFPAVLLALVLPSLTDRGIRRAALAGAVVAVAAAPFLPAGLPPLLAVAGLALLGRPAAPAAGPGTSRPGPAEHGASPGAR